MSEPSPERTRARVVVIGGGAAGFFGAIACAETAGRALDIVIVERGREVLGKVRISGGGRCNVTHDLDDPRALSECYPRGAKALLGPLHRWRQSDTVAWFEARGVELKTESDGRMFPTTDRASTVIDCLRGAAQELGVRVETGCGVRVVNTRGEGGFEILTEDGNELLADAVLIATGGTRSGSACAPSISTGHELEPAVPSLFTIRIQDPTLTGLAGVSVPEAVVSVAGSKFSARGPLLATHWGLSGPAVLKLSAWGARELEGRGYRFELVVDWLGAGVSEEAVQACFERQRREHGARQVAKRSPFEKLPRRLWARLVSAAGVPAGATWSVLSKAAGAGLCDALRGERLPVTGKSLNKDEFVTCGGVRLQDIDLKTMGSRRVPGLYFAGEVLDIDGLTGGFNFQSAWTTGRIAGEAIAEQLR